MHSTTKKKPLPLLSPRLRNSYDFKLAHQSKKSSLLTGLTDTGGSAVEQLRKVPGAATGKVTGLMSPQLVTLRPEAQHQAYRSRMGGPEPLSPGVGCSIGSPQPICLQKAQIRFTEKYFRNRNKKMAFDDHTKSLNQNSVILTTQIPTSVESLATFEDTESSTLASLRKARPQKKEKNMYATQTHALRGSTQLKQPLSIELFQKEGQLEVYPREGEQSPPRNFGWLAPPNITSSIPAASRLSSVQLSPLNPAAFDRRQKPAKKKSTKKQQVKAQLQISTCPALSRASGGLKYAMTTKASKAVDFSLQCQDPVQFKIEKLKRRLEDLNATPVSFARPVQKDSPNRSLKSKVEEFESAKAIPAGIISHQNEPQRFSLVGGQVGCTSYVERFSGTFSDSGREGRALLQSPAEGCTSQSRKEVQPDLWKASFDQRKKQQARNLMVTLNREVDKLERVHERQAKKELLSTYKKDFGIKISPKKVKESTSENLQVLLAKKVHKMKMEQAALRIQKWFRSERKKISFVHRVRQVVESVVRIQKLQRAQKLKREINKRIKAKESSATLIQNCLRGHIARQDVNRMKILMSAEELHDHYQRVDRVMKSHFQRLIRRAWFDFKRRKELAEKAEIKKKNSNGRIQHKNSYKHQRYSGKQPVGILKSSGQAEGKYFIHSPQRRSQQSGMSPNETPKITPQAVQRHPVVGVAPM